MANSTKEEVKKSVAGGASEKNVASSVFGDRLGSWVPKADVEAFKVAAYTAALLVFVCICFAGIWAVYHLLFAFLKPMLWAVLVGTCIFPFKKVVTDTFRSWLRHLRDSGTPLALGVVLLPLKWLDSCSEALWSLVASPSVFYILGGFLGMKLLTYESTFIAVVNMATKGYLLLDTFIQVFSSYWVVPAAVLYTVVFVVWEKRQVTAGGNVNKRLGHILCAPIWCWLLCFGSSFFGFLRVPVFVGASVVLALLAGGALSGLFDEGGDQAKGEGEKDLDSPSDEAAAEKAVNAGDMYLRCVLGACLLLWTVRHTWILGLLAIPLIFALGKIVARGSGITSAIYTKVNGGIVYLREQFGPVIDIAIPSTMRSFFKVLFTGDQKIIAGLEGSMDLLSSVVVMVVFLLVAIVAGIFVVVQVHGETVHLFRLSASLLNPEETMSGWMAGAVNFTDSKLSEHPIDSYVDEAYQYGRTWLAEHVRKLADPADVKRADMLEAQIKLLVDNLYKIVTSEQTAKKPETVSDIWSHLQPSLDVSQLTNEVTMIVQENVGTLLSIAESVWSVLTTNLAIVFSFLGAILGLVFGFAMELLNVIIGIVVFLTMLYYLLACSEKQWKPLELLGNLSFIKDEDADGSKKGFSSAVEQAIRGVFVLTCKKSVFYGSYAWFIHTLFELNVVFVPSILASLFAAIPLTAPYWVSLPGALELWLVRDEGGAAVLFMLCSIAPVCFADSAFYHEVRGSHPYLTGLAIVGGMYWLGLEGAIIGPILLCCVLVLFNMFIAPD